MELGQRSAAWIPTSCVLGPFQNAIRWSKWNAPSSGPPVRRNADDPWSQPRHSGVGWPRSLARRTQWGCRRALPIRHLFKTSAWSKNRHARHTNAAVAHLLHLSFSRRPPRKQRAQPSWPSPFRFRFHFLILLLLLRGLCPRLLRVELRALRVVCLCVAPVACLRLGFGVALAGRRRWGPTRGSIHRHLWLPGSSTSIQVVVRFARVRWVLEIFVVRDTMFDVFGRFVATLTPLLRQVLIALSDRFLCCGLTFQHC